MTLTLVGPPANGTIDEYPSGLIVLRAEDYIGPARGTLAAVSDTDSLVGTVVEETQAFAVPTTLVEVAASQRWPLASDTLRIPIATLSPYAAGETGFHAMVSLKVAGEPPTNAMYDKQWASYRGGTCAMVWGRDTTMIEASRIHTAVFGNQYKITDFARIFWSTISGNTNLVLRAWGVTGGTLNYKIDLIYLMPFRTSGDGLRVQFGPSNYPAFDLLSNGVVWRDEDNDDTDNVIGKFSTNWTRDVGEVWFQPILLDFQEANDEPSSYDINGGGDWGGWDPLFGPLDPQSYLSFIAAPRYIPQVTLINEPFDGAATTGAGIVAATPEGYGYAGEGGNFGGAAHPSGTSGWTKDGSGNLRCAIKSSSVLPAGGPYAGTPHADLMFGIVEWVGVSTDPRNARQRIYQLDDFILETTFACDTSAGEINMLVGFQAWGVNVNQGPTPLGMLNNGYGCRLQLSGGVLNARMTYLESTGAVSPSFYPPSANTLYDFTSTTTIDAAYSAGTVYRIKVERRRYRIRAKVWADGGSEPGTWTFDAYMPFRWGDAATTATGFIDYPYDTNWPGNVQHDDIFSEVWGNHSSSIPGITCWPNPVTPHQMALIKEFIVTIDPAGSTPIDMGVQEENYDGTDPSNELTIPYATEPSWRFVEGSLRKRHFNADTNGFNLRAWKDGSAGPELQSSGLPFVWELGVLRRRPQIYRRTYG